MGDWFSQPQRVQDDQLAKTVERSSSKLQNTLRQSAQDLVWAQAQAASDLVVSQARLSEGIEAVSSAVSSLDSGLSAMSYSLDRGFADLSYQLRLQSQQLDTILEAIRAPLDTKSKELLNRARDAYSNGWFDEAEKDFTRSARLNPYDFTIHQHLGNIAFLHRADLGNARKHFSDAAKYAGPKSRPDAAIAYLSIALVSEREENWTDALDNAERALERLDVPETRYASARYLAMTGAEDRLITEHLLLAFRRRLSLCAGAEQDDLLQNRPAAVRAALSQYRDEIRGSIRERNRLFKMGLNGANKVLEESYEEDLASVVRDAEQARADALRLAGNDAIFDLYDANALLHDFMVRFGTETGQAAARIATGAESNAGKIESDDRARLYKAEAKARDIDGQRLGWGLGGMVIGAVLLLSTAGFQGCFMGILMGFFGGVLLSIAMASSAKTCRNRAADVQGWRDYAAIFRKLQQRLADWLAAVNKTAREQVVGEPSGEPVRDAKPVVVALPPAEEPDEPERPKRDEEDFFAAG